MRGGREDGTMRGVIRVRVGFEETDLMILSKSCAEKRRWGVCEVVLHDGEEVSDAKPL